MTSVGSYRTSAADRFMGQYTALILIILTFMVASFAQQGQKNIEKKKAAVSIIEPTVKSPANERVLVGSYQIDGLFDEHQRIKEEKLSSIAEVLRVHDLDLEVELHESNNGSHDEILAKMVTISRWLESLQIRDMGYLVRVGGSESSGNIDSATLTITRRGYDLLN